MWGRALSINCRQRMPRKVFSGVPALLRKNERNPPGCAWDTLPDKHGVNQLVSQGFPGVRLGKADLPGHRPCVPGTGKFAGVASCDRCPPIQRLPGAGYLWWCGYDSSSFSFVCCFSRFGFFSLKTPLSFVSTFLFLFVAASSQMLLILVWQVMYRWEGKTGTIWQFRVCYEKSALWGRKLPDTSRESQESPRQTKPKKGQFMNFSRGQTGTNVRYESRLFPKEKHQNSQKWAKFMNFSFWPFLWFGLPGRLLRKQESVADSGCLHVSQNLVNKASGDSVLQVLCYQQQTPRQ